MSKNTSDEESEIGGQTDGERTVPLLSEKLIAQLQGAVDAARRKRTGPNAGGGSLGASAETPGTRQFLVAADETQLPPDLVGHESHRIR
jgi:hypothetical protein